MGPHLALFFISDKDQADETFRLIDRLFTHHILCVYSSKEIKQCALPYPQKS
jgi:hypothetical protein